MAVNLERSVNQTIPPHLATSLAKRGVVLPLLYDFTFDYEFFPIHKSTAIYTLLFSLPRPVYDVLVI